MRYSTFLLIIYSGVNMFKKMLPIVFKKNHCIERRMREFPHSFDALMDDSMTYKLNENEVKQTIEIIRNSQ